MTVIHPQLPLTPEAAQILDGQVSQEPLLSSPNPTSQTCPNSPSSEIIRHILIGSPAGVQETIRLIHVRRYFIDQSFWTGPVAIGPDGVTITREEGQVLAYLMRRRSLDTREA